MQTKEDLVIEKKEKVTIPPRYKVILLNDNFTPFQWVIFLLCNVFHKTLMEAEEITLTVHEDGSGIVHTYPSKEIAESKARKANELSRQHGFPLKCVTEKE